MGGRHREPSPSPPSPETPKAEGGRSFGPLRYPSVAWALPTEASGALAVEVGELGAWLAQGLLSVSSRVTQSPLSQAQEHPPLGPSAFVLRSTLPLHWSQAWLRLPVLSLPSPHFFVKSCFPTQLPRLHSVAPALQLQAAGVKGNPRKEPKNLVWRDVSLGQPSRTPQGSGLELVRVCGGGVQKGKTEVEGWGRGREKVWGERESLGR
ncbi:uncharacterized protein LOC108580756 [Papio anubis]|uniref:uncharacterized protein LOC108580756 n=1 Tax=Papio anubis TaxID=9555 RepID=UPI0012AD40E1|nr:uncharacterized protein LOC108580756 [Papio anubis]